MRMCFYLANPLACSVTPHVPQRAVLQRVGRDSDCTECHRYHNGGEPFAGAGAKNRGAPHPGTIEQFLSGTLQGK